jgi:hypothetical protein
MYAWLFVAVCVWLCVDLPCLAFLPQHAPLSAPFTMHVCVCVCVHKMDAFVLSSCRFLVAVMTLVPDHCQGNVSPVPVVPVGVVSCQGHREVDEGACAPRHRGRRV